MGSLVSGRQPSAVAVARASEQAELLEGPASLFHQRDLSPVTELALRLFHMCEVTMNFQPPEIIRMIK